ncbi:hypothetical protein M9H77_18895 [Catharanthus roseus]|uniref:Uncharacterized protein n=1 Tax=Catharanthus roseus TaxID=4058 RepID=A0ACC0B8W1_CATRO|nr:hypothetical protein M9H77_18895 [Catharanthus roseus]
MISNKKVYGWSSMMICSLSNYFMFMKSRVESIGEDVHDLAVGDMVIPIFIFSEYTVVDVASVTKIDPNTIPPNRACLLSCGVSTEGARLCGATRIIGVDINPKKLEIAMKFGVTEFVNSKSCVDKSVSNVILDMTKDGVDYYFECVGMASLVQEAYACCRKGWGKTILQGVDRLDVELNFNSFEVLLSRTTLMGSVLDDVNQLDIQEHQGVVTRAKAKQLNSLNFDVQDIMGLKF